MNITSNGTQGNATGNVALLAVFTIRTYMTQALEHFQPFLVLVIIFMASYLFCLCMNSFIISCFKWKGANVSKRKQILAKRGRYRTLLIMGIILNTSFLFILLYLFFKMYNIDTLQMGQMTLALAGIAFAYVIGLGVFKGLQIATSMFEYKGVYDLVASGKTIGPVIYLGVSGDQVKFFDVRNNIDMQISAMRMDKYIIYSYPMKPEEPILRQSIRPYSKWARFLSLERRLMKDMIPKYVRHKSLLQLYIKDPI